MPSTKSVHSRIAVLCLTIAFAFGPSLLPLRAADTHDELLRARAQVHYAHVPRQVLAFYYDWYGNPSVTGHWVHWEKVDAANQRIGSATDFPTMGAYDSHDPKIVEQQFRMAKDAGISGFIVTWWSQKDFHDQTMPLLLEMAQKYGLSLTVYFETVRPEGPVGDLLYLLEKYGKNPAWLKVNGQPVIFIYSRAVEQIKVDGWLRVMDEANRRYPGGAVFIGDQITKAAAPVFDGVHTYNITGRIAGKSVEQIHAWAKVAFPDWVRIAGTNRISCLTVIPGYDDSTQGRSLPRPITERNRGQTYQALWEEAVAANPDWILITTWNEWHEGSEIEPSVQNSDTALKTTAAFAPKFRALPPRTP